MYLCTKESRKKEVEELVETVKKEHQQKVACLARDLEQVSLQQSKQLEEIAHLRSETRLNWEEKERELCERHEREMRAAEETRREEIERWTSELALVKTENERVVGEMTERHRAELEAARLTVQEKVGAEEGRRWREMERRLREEMGVREEELAQRASCLSEELRSVRDQLMLARQRESEATQQLEVSQSEVCGLRGRLEEGEREIERLREELVLLRTRAEVAENEREQWREKLSEREGWAMKPFLQEPHIFSNRGVSQTGGRAEGGRSSNSVSTVSSPGEVERAGEREGSTHNAAPLFNEGTVQFSLLHRESQLTHSVLTHTNLILTQELLRLRKEKEELRLQYAREIEAAHAQIGVREEELVARHNSQLHEIHQLHQRGQYTQPSL